MISTIIAGDYYSIPLTFSDYPATSGYVVKLALRGPSLLNVTATANGDDYIVELLSATTQLLQEGTYQYAITATLNAQRTTIETGFIVVSGDISSAAAKILNLEKRISIIEAVLDSKITSDMESFSIAGRSVTRIPITELMEIRANAYRELAAFTGKRPSRTVRVSLTAVR